MKPSAHLGLLRLLVQSANRRMARADNGIRIPQRKRDMVGVRAICTGLLRVALASVLIVTGVSSASAEAECTVTAITSHKVLEPAGNGQAAVVQEPSPEEERQPPGSSPFHCAFSHACNGIAVPAGPATDPRLVVERSDYLMTALAPLGATGPPMAERPPQA